MACIFMEFCSHHHKQFWEILITPKRNAAPLSCHSPIPLGYMPRSSRGFLKQRNEKLDFHF